MREGALFAIMFGLGPAYLFFVQHRLPVGLMCSGWQPWLSTMATNVAIAAVVAAMIGLVGVAPFLLVHLPIMVLAASIGVWLFYIQHQFEDTYWVAEAEWDFRTAALQGSSFYDLPRILHWLTGYIGFHHIHHLSSKVPNYHLRACFEQNSEFWQAKRLTLLDSLRCPRLALWDEGHHALVSFPSWHGALAPRIG